MADDLTVRSHAAQAAIPAQAGEKPQVDPRRAELDRLKSLAKERHGRVLTDKAIEAMLTRREAKLEQAEKQETSKLEFESSQAKETVAGKSEKAQEQNLKKATGAKEARGADGLTNEDRQSIRSDPKAGPKLPPAEAKPTTPEKAMQILTNMVGLLTVDGQPFDLEAYAKTLKEKPPTPPKDSSPPTTKAGTTPQPRVAQPTTGPQPKPQTPARPESGPTTSRPSPGALQTGKGALSTTLPMESTNPAARAAQLNLASNLASARLSMKIGSDTNLIGTKVSGDGLFNAGGGLITNSSFDGMNFNWDAFFSLFIIRSTKDLHEWRKAMKEFRRLEGQFAIGVISLQKTMMKLRQSFEKWKAMVALGGALKNLPQAYLQGQVNDAAGQISSAKAWTEYRTKSQELVQNLPVAPEHRQRYGRVLQQNILTDSQLEEMVTSGALTQQDVDRYKRDQRNLDRMQGGAAGRMALISDDIVQARAEMGPPTEEEYLRRQSLELEFGRARQQFESQVAGLAGDDLGRAMLNEQRLRLSAVASELKQNEEDLVSRLPATTAELTQVRRDRAAVLRQIIVLDQALVRNEPRPEEYQAEIDRRREELEARQTPGTGVQPLSRAEENELRGLQRPVSLIGGTRPNDVADEVLDIPPAGGSDAEADRAVLALETLEDEANAGNQIAGARREAGAHDMKFDRNVDKVNAAVSRVGSDPFFVQAVDKAIGSALAQAYAARSEIDAELRQHTAKAQGLINQLTQLLAMSRAR